MLFNLSLEYMETAQRLHALEPGSQFAMVKDAGHCANVDNSASFNAVLESFLDKA